MKNLGLICLILIFPIHLFAVTNYVKTTTDVNGIAVGFSIDPSNNKLPYLYKEVSVTANSGVTYNMVSLLGRYGTGGTVKNDAASDITVALSTNGVLYGSPITIKTTESLDLNFAIMFQSLAVQVTSTSSIRVLVR